MSDYIVYKKVPCEHTAELYYESSNLRCMNQEYDLQEVDLADAIRELLGGNSKLARIIRQVAEPVRFR